MRITSLVAALALIEPVRAQQLAPVGGVELQPFGAAVRRLVDALELAGAPLPEAERAALTRALQSSDAELALREAQGVLDAHCLAGVHVNAESRVDVVAGPAPARLVQHGWRAFLVKVHNEAGVTARLQATSPNAAPIVTGSSSLPEPPPPLPGHELRERFLDLEMLARRPLAARLSGLALEYRVLLVHSVAAGKREATIAFDVGQGTQDLGFRAELAVLFDCAPAVPVELEVLDVDGTPTTASFVFRDAHGRVYPAMSRRLAPDFFFHAQVYRKSGETVLLPPGRFTVEWSRGPEYLVGAREIAVPDAEHHAESFRLERWIHLAKLGWRSGDHHVHAAGCAHYDSPTQGVAPADMMRHVLGEDLNVGCVLSWGPCWYHQKQFFAGEVHALSTGDHVMRYDVEVSGFPSSHAGHLCLLRLVEDDYPGTTRIEQWPSWNLPVLRWARSQGAVVGYSHSGWGLAVAGDTLPSHEVPAFDGIGANEYVVDVVHDAVDFISAVDTPAVWELNVWYHTLNCGFRTRISGETDFPCIYGERVGLGRSYVSLPPGPVDFDAWVDGLRDGRSYVSDGMSHLLDLEVGGLAIGTRGAGGAVSQLDLTEPATVKVRARVAARLGERPDERLRARPLDEKPYWHLERARIGGTRQVAVELVANGVAVARREITADGALATIEFDHAVDDSQWLALRVFPSSHTNPVFVQVAGRPIRASRRSAEWCEQAVERCWQQKVGRTREAERAAARAAYDVARDAYRRIARESASR